MTTPYFVPTESLMVAMEVAAMRGVAVKLLLPGRSNHRVTYHAGRSFYTPLIEAGVEVREYQPGIVHAKTLVADRQVALVGSANMDLRSFRLNFEVHALVHDATTADRPGPRLRRRGGPEPARGARGLEVAGVDAEAARRSVASRLAAALTADAHQLGRRESISLSRSLPAAFTVASGPVTLKNQRPLGDSTMSPTSR